MTINPLGYGKQADFLSLIQRALAVERIAAHLDLIRLDILHIPTITTTYDTPLQLHRHLSGRTLESLDRIGQAYLDILHIY